MGSYPTKKPHAMWDLKLGGSGYLLTFGMMVFIREFDQRKPNKIKTADNKFYFFTTLITL